jgi:hypothetical protein
MDASGTLLGIVSEGDLIRRRDVARDERTSWWLEMLAEGEDIAPELLAYIRSGDRLARDVMTREVVTVEEQTPLPEVTRLLEEHRIKRVPVLRQDQVVGIVSRADLLRALTYEEEITKGPPRPSTSFEMSRPVPFAFDEFGGSTGAPRLPPKPSIAPRIRAASASWVISRCLRDQARSRYDLVLDDR